ncbi:MAG: hypothetical protein ACRDWI_15670, partial [Jiangellaceae bacterium]
MRLRDRRPPDRDQVRAARQRLAAVSARPAGRSLAVAGGQVARVARRERTGWVPEVPPGLAAAAGPLPAADGQAGPGADESQPGAGSRRAAAD